MKVLLILNDPPYGTERSFNALRLSMTLVGRDDTQARIFLMGDAVSCAMAGQKTPNGFYNLERMLRSLSAKGALIGCCGSCLDARGMCDSQLVQGTRRSDMDELADWTLWADKAIVF